MMDIQEIRDRVGDSILMAMSKQVEWCTEWLKGPKMDYLTREDIDPFIDKILFYLAEKGACFPVEEELPGFIDKIMVGKSAGYIAGLQDGINGLLKAGYKKVITLKEMMGGDK